MTLYDEMYGGATTVVEAAGGVEAELAEVRAALRQEQDTNLHLMEEGLADIELALEDVGWTKLAAGESAGFTREGLRRAAALARVLAVANPLVRRGLALRVAYVWGQGLQVAARANGSDGGQDVNAVVQAFLTDPRNVVAFSGAQACEELERTLGTDGNAFHALFTKPTTGRVQVRRIPFDEITAVISNPEDAAERWYYRREWTAEVVRADGTTERERRAAYYPDINYTPRRQPSTLNGVVVRWDAPVRHQAVNRLEGWTYGVGDAFPALFWARAYKEFLEDWARLVKALSRFAWRATTKGNKADTLRGKLAAQPVRPAPYGPESNPAGATAVMSPDTTLEAIPKTGATIDSDSGRPLAAMVAAALDVPVTMLLGDPGTTGARAVAETLDNPTELAMTMRRGSHTECRRDILAYVIRQAVKAPGGGLRGTVQYEDGQEVVRLLNPDEAMVDFEWPDLTSEPIETLVKAIAAADATGKLPPLTIARYLLTAFKDGDADDVLDELTGDTGEFVDPLAGAAAAAVQRARNGGTEQEAARYARDLAPAPTS